MGYRCRWLATKGRDREAILRRLELHAIAELVEEVYDTGLYALEIEDWVIVIGDGWDYMNVVKRAQAAKLSDDGEVLYFYTDDTPMAFELTLFRGGSAAWSFTYDGSDGVSTPVLDGTVPFDARALLGRLEKQQAKAGGPKAGVDHIYELAPTYAKTLVGFRHDTSLGSGEHVPIWQLAR